MLSPSKRYPKVRMQFLSIVDQESTYSEMEDSNGRGGNISPFV
jgi:hypothetical protein